MVDVGKGVFGSTGASDGFAGQNLFPICPVVDAVAPAKLESVCRATRSIACELHGGSFNGFHFNVRLRLPAVMSSFPSGGIVAFTIFQSRAAQQRGKQATAERKKPNHFGAARSKQESGGGDET